MERTFTVSEVRFLDRSFLVESFINPWGEDDPIMAQIHVGAFDEPQTLNFWCSAIADAPADSLAIDVGAFTGLFSLVATILRPDIKSIALEPATATFGRLLSNIAWNNLDTRIIPANLAASDRFEDIQFPHAFGIYTMSPGEARASDQAIDHTQLTRCIPLDAILHKDNLPNYLSSKGISVYPFSRVSAIKIDVEGHEFSVIRGSRTLIERHRPVIVCETWNDDATSKLEMELGQMQYRLLLLPGERNVAFIANEAFDEVMANYETWKQLNGNVLTLQAHRILTHMIGTGLIRKQIETSAPQTACHCM